MLDIEICIFLKHFSLELCVLGKDSKGKIAGRHSIYRRVKTAMISDVVIDASFGSLVLIIISITFVWLSDLVELANLTSTALQSAGTLCPGLNKIISPLTSRGRGRFTTSPSLIVHCNDRHGDIGLWRWGKFKVVHVSVFWQSEIIL